ncbi:hypothetical protein C2G38_2209856 [Gigaspora rosea]|uniref:Uncharacterized protein n=1 Tax=Gigaspora rosea TaxID=44941 RepID=A0A397UFX2_9GLOM|nr:hypothetical protein C2G38_2209856 [Gigaspora rosea]
MSITCIPFRLCIVLSKVGKIIDALLTLDKLSSSLTLINVGAKALNQPAVLAESKPSLPTLLFKNGNLKFKNTGAIYGSTPKSPFEFEFCDTGLYKPKSVINQMDELYKAQFSKIIKAFYGSVDNLNNYSIEELIKANLKNKNAYLLMIIEKSNSIVKSLD